MSHIHADLMMQYAIDAAANEQPWELWQYSMDGESWAFCTNHPNWDIRTNYRHAPKQKVFEQLVTPITNADDIALYQPYWFIDIENNTITDCCNYNPDMLRQHMQQFFVYADVQDADNALKFLKNFKK